MRVPSNDMLAILVRAFSTVIAVVVAVAVTANLGDSGGGKVLSAVIIAAVIAALEWLMVWTPKHSARARHLLDPRSVMAGVWVQNVVRVRGKDGLVEGPNRFAIYSIDYTDSDGYSVSGRAYDERGAEYARYWSVGAAMFTRSGREMTYVFQGTITERRSLTEYDRDQTGLTKLSLASDDNSGTGRVEHVAEDRSIDFDFFRVTSEWLTERGLGQYKPSRLRDVGIRNQFAIEFSRTLRPMADDG